MKWAVYVTLIMTRFWVSRESVKTRSSIVAMPTEYALIRPKVWEADVPGGDDRHEHAGVEGLTVFEYEREGEAGHSGLFYRTRFGARGVPGAALWVLLRDQRGEPDRF